MSTNGGDMSASCRVCPSCSKQNREKDRFCVSCGAELRVCAPPAAVAPEPAPSEAKVGTSPPQAWLAKAKTWSAVSFGRGRLWWGRRSKRIQLVLVGGAVLVLAVLGTLVGVAVWTLKGTGNGTENVVWDGGSTSTSQYGEASASDDATATTAFVSQDPEEGTLVPGAAPAGEWCSFGTAWGDTLFLLNDKGALYAVDAQDGHAKWGFSTIYSVNWPVAVSDGAVCFLTVDQWSQGDAYESTGYLYVLDPESGRLKWRSASNGWSAPVIWNGLVYACGSDDWVYAFDVDTGQQKWKADVAAVAPLGVVDGKLILGADFRGSRGPTGDEMADYLENSGDDAYGFKAVDAKTGKWKWSTDLRLLGLGGLGFYEGKIYYSGDYLYALSAGTGKQAWEFDCGFDMPAMSDPFVSGGLVYIDGQEDAEADYWPSYLWAVDPKTGKQKWRFDHKGHSGWSTAGQGVVCTCDDRGLHALDATTGRELWSLKASGKFFRCEPLVGGGVAYAIWERSDSGGDASLYALDLKTGKQKWVLKLGASNASPSSPVTTTTTTLPSTTSTVEVTVTSTVSSSTTTTTEPAGP
jgi:outer membrane protein assembly factor BamB